MKKKTYYLGKNKNYLAIWEVKNPRGIVQLVHGMVENIDRYEDLAKSLNNQGFIVVGHDHIGHGKTVKNTDDFGVFPEDWRVLVKDVRRVQRHISKKYKDLPYFLLGHSMGSFVVRIYSAYYGGDIDGLIIMGTGQKNVLASQFGIYLVKMLKKIYGSKHRSELIKRFNTEYYNKKFKPNRTSSDWLSRDDKEVDRYLKSPYSRFNPTLGMYQTLFTYANKSARKGYIKKIPKDLPVLLISGEDDPVGDFGKGVIKLFGIMKDNEDVSLKLYPKDRHEILNELNKEEVVDDIISWIEDRL